MSGWNSQVIEEFRAYGGDDVPAETTRRIPVIALQRL